MKWTYLGYYFIYNQTHFLHMFTQTFAQSLSELILDWAAIKWEHFSHFSFHSNPVFLHRPSRYVYEIAKLANVPSLTCALPLGGLCLKKTWHFWKVVNIQYTVPLYWSQLFTVDAWCRHVDSHCEDYTRLVCRDVNRRWLGEDKDWEPYPLCQVAEHSTCPHNLADVFRLVYQCLTCHILTMPSHFNQANSAVWTHERVHSIVRSFFCSLWVWE